MYVVLNALLHCFERQKLALNCIFNFFILMLLLLWLITMMND